MGTFERPTADGTGIAPVGPVGFDALSVFVDQTGTYILESRQEDFEIWDGLIAVYASEFDPDEPLRNLLAIADDGPGGVGTSRLEVVLHPGIIYRVVTMAAGPEVTDEGVRGFSNRLAGPGTVRKSACFQVGDELEVGDDASDLSLLDEGFCVRVEWSTPDGNRGLGRPVSLRSNESGMFWFFEPDNWELSVKVLDGCSLNDHYWVFLSGSTNVGFVVTVLVQGAPLIAKTYTNPAGRPAQPVLDTAAFSCSQILSGAPRLPDRSVARESRSP